MLLAVFLWSPYLPRANALQAMEHQAGLHG
jgi:hypothetical protein